MGLLGVNKPKPNEASTTTPTVTVMTTMMDFVFIWKNVILLGDREQDCVRPWRWLAAMQAHNQCFRLIRFFGGIVTEVATH